MSDTSETVFRETSMEQWSEKVLTQNPSRDHAAMLYSFFFFLFIND